MPVIAPTPKVPARVAFAPARVNAVVAEELDLITSSPPVCVKLPKVVPAAFKSISSPSASSIISPDESNVMSVPSFVIVSSAILPTFVMFVSAKLVVPVIVKSPATVTLSPKVTSEVPCPIVIAMPDVSVAIFKAPVAFVK